MQLEFVYKNKDASGTAIKYEIAEGANISMSYNEDLSNGTLLIRETSQIDIEPYDEIIIYGLDYVDKLYMLVESYVCKETRNKYDDKEYTYEIAIMSQTKLLENKILPSLAITPKTNGNKTIYEYLVRYNDLYGQKVRTETGFANKFSFDVGTKFDDVCPELQFNNPTFRECLTQLMMVKNCIPIVQNNVISYIDLSSKNDLVDKDDPYIAYVETAQSSEDYVSSLKTNIKNVIQEDYTDFVEYVGLRNANSASVNSNEMYIYTQHPIYSIDKIELCTFVTYSYDVATVKTRYLELDVTDLVYEKSEWELKYIQSSIDLQDFANLKNYQNSTAYYVRGSNVINNLNATTRYQVVFPQQLNLIQMWAKSYGTKKLRDRGETVLWSPFIDERPCLSPIKPPNDNFWNRVGFKIRYKSKDNIVTNLSKTKIQTTEREVVDNQNNNYINAYTFGLLEYAKANRLGNKMKNYSARFPRNYSELPVVGDYYEGNEIIYKIDYQLWQDAVDATIYTCPNYVLRNYFTSVQSKLRSWNIVDGNEAFAREDNIKMYWEFSKSFHQETQLKSTTKKPFRIFHDQTTERRSSARYFLSPITDVDLDATDLLFKTDNGNGCVLETLKNICGNSLIISGGFNDNFIFYRYMVEGQYTVNNGSLQGIYSYCNSSSATLENLTVVFRKSLKPITWEDFKEVTDQEAAYIGAFDAVVSTGAGYYTTPSFERGGRIILVNDIPYYKDNKEITKINLQFEYCSDNEDEVLVCEEFMKSLINKIPLSQLKIRVLRNQQAVSSVLPSTVDDIDISNLVFHDVLITDFVSKFTINNITANDTFFIYNTNNNKVLLSGYGNEIYCNPLNDRRKEVYEKDGNDWKIKTSI